MRYLVAVSGGVDSVVLLHKLVSSGEHELLVAHFDHGIRPESDADARFVEGLAKYYGLTFEMRREEMGSHASEALARERRYTFLHEMAGAHGATIVTAHHADDAVETIAINLLRGTGWRGLAVLDTPAVVRPLLSLTKRDIYDYALTHQLEWAEDETNATDAYLRNRLRRRIRVSLTDEAIATLLELRENQINLKHAITHEEHAIIGDSRQYSRYLFTHVDVIVATELLRYLTNHGITRPQAERALHAIKTMQAGATTDIGGGITLRFSQREFTIQTP